MVQMGLLLQANVNSRVPRRPASFFDSTCTSASFFTALSGLGESRRRLADSVWKASQSSIKTVRLKVEYKGWKVEYKGWKLSGAGIQAKSNWDES